MKRERETRKILQMTAAKAKPRCSSTTGSTVVLIAELQEYTLSRLI